MFEASLGFIFGFFLTTVFWFVLFFYEVEGNDSDLVERPKEDEE